MGRTFTPRFDANDNMRGFDVSPNGATLEKRPTKELERKVVIETPDSGHLAIQAVLDKRHAADVAPQTPKPEGWKH